MKNRFLWCTFLNAGKDFNDWKCQSFIIMCVPTIRQEIMLRSSFFFFRWTRAMRMWRKIPSTTADARRDYQNEFGAWKAHWWLIRPVFRSDLSEFYWKMYSKVLMLITAVALYPVLMYVSQSSKLAITDTRKLFFSLRTNENSNEILSRHSCYFALFRNNT